MPISLEGNSYKEQALKEEGRIDWVDSLKFLGIWAIYIGHFGEAGGKLYPFVFHYHVPLFFFMSGFFVRQYDIHIQSFIKKKAIQLMLPYFVFSLLALGYFTLVHNWDSSQMLAAAKTFVFGIRNKVFAGSLWFIPCLFIVSVLHYFVLAVSKRLWVPVLISFISFLGCQWLLSNNPILKPSWIFNVDSALYYWLYFAVGSVAFPLLANTPHSSRLRWIWGTASTFAIAFAILSLIKGPDYLLGKIILVLPWLSNIGGQISLYLYLPISALVLIFANVVVAKAICDIQLLRRMGSETLTFCGTENVCKDFLVQMLALVGLALHLTNPLITSLYAFLCLFASCHLIVPTVNLLILKLKNALAIRAHSTTPIETRRT